MRSSSDDGIEAGNDESERSAARVSRPARFARALRDWTKSLLIALLLFTVVRTFLVEAFRIPTRSMETTLLAGDFLLVNKAVYGAQVPGTRTRLPAFGEPQRGDVIVFTPPHEPDRHYVKRVVGMPHDTLAMIDKTLYVNGELLSEPYARYSDSNPFGDYSAASMLWQRAFLAHRIEERTYHPSRDNWGPLIVPADRYFVLGDNRDDSEDSRFWGFVHEEAVTGRPLLVYYSFEPGALGSLAYLTQVRWSRIGGLIH
ncbi:MAG TPA: signal peptidase I [Longimicrobiales bacterium]|nr:signal peptidase I [Longimicrobiales bacterium]